MKFSLDHASTLIKYIGISFITGAISHGFFSGERQVYTAIFGIFCFVIGTLIEKDTDKNIQNVLLSVWLAISIGAVTGWLQHFPDSPERSVWIVPLGMALSIPFFAMIHKEKIASLYSLAIIIWSWVLSMALYLMIENYNLGGHSHIEPITIQNVGTIPDIETIISPSTSHTEADTHNH